MEERRLQFGVRSGATTGGASWNPGNAATFSKTIGSLTITIKALPSPAKLYWDATDGFGVKNSGSNGYETDEIESKEILKITFSAPVILNRIYVSDLFIEQASGYTYKEKGFYQVDGNAKTSFLATQPTGTNGERWVDIDATANCLFLTAPGKVFSKNCYWQNHEFSLAMLDITPTPEPAAMALLGVGVGIAGVAFARRRKRARG